MAMLMFSDRTSISVCPVSANMANCLSSPLRNCSQEQESILTRTKNILLILHSGKGKNPTNPIGRVPGERDAQDGILNAAQCQ